MKIVLTIAGSDSGGGAGIQADLKTFSALGTYGSSVITCITAQNTLEVTSVANVDIHMIKDQIHTTIKDITPSAIKIGMLGSIAIIEAVAQALSEYPNIPIVLDPVMVSKTGFYLLKENATEQLKTLLFPMVKIITPNLLEAQALVGHPLKTQKNIENACKDLIKMGPQYVLVKGGHRLNTDLAIDILYDGKKFTEYKAPRLNVKHTHGTGCTLSSAIAAFIAKGLSVYEAVTYAKDYVTQAISEAFGVGKGIGPLHHFFPFFDNQGRRKND